MPQDWPSRRIQEAMNMPAQVCHLSEVAVPTQSEVADRFRDLYPELLSRACRIAARERDPEEVVQELLSFAWSNFSSTARKGRWLTASQLSWVGMKRVRGEGCSLGSKRSTTDALSPICLRKKRTRIYHLSAMADAAVPKGIRVRFHEVITQGCHGPAEAAAVRLDWCSLRSGLPLQQRRVLDGLAAGRGTNEIAEKLRVSASRVSQIKTDLGRAVAGFFASTLPTSLGGAR
jgi:hypothetical protein